MATATYTIELSGLSEASRKNYEIRLNKLQQLTGKPLKYILCHPRETLQTLTLNSMPPSTIANYATPICKVFASNPTLSNKYTKSYTKWRDILTTHTTETRQTVSQKETIDYPAIYEKLKHTHKVPHFQYLLFSLLAHIPQLKRSDVTYFGNMPINSTPSANNHVNLTTPNPYIFVNNTKVYINQQLHDDIANSLKQQPRQYLFTNKQNQPYTKANSFNQFIKRLQDKTCGDIPPY